MKIDDTLTRARANLTAKPADPHGQLVERYARMIEAADLSDPLADGNLPAMAKALKIDGALLLRQLDMERFRRHIESGITTDSQSTARPHT